MVKASKLLKSRSEPAPLEIVKRKEWEIGLGIFVAFFLTAYFLLAANAYLEGNLPPLSLIRFLMVTTLWPVSWETSWGDALSAVTRWNMRFFSSSPKRILRILGWLFISRAEVIYYFKISSLSLLRSMFFFISFSYMRKRNKKRIAKGQGWERYFEMYLR